MDKEKIALNKNICQNGKFCFKVNPVHFNEYSHPHLESMIETGRNPESREYDIPGEFSNSKSSFFIKEQLRIVEQKMKSQSEDSKILSVENDEKSSKAKTTSSKAPQNKTKKQKSKEKSEQNPKTTTTEDSNEANIMPEIGPESSNSSCPPNTSIKSEEAQLSSKNEIDEERAQLTHVIDAAFMNEFMNKFFPVIMPKGKIAEKLKNAAPYNIFLTTVTDSPATHTDPLSVTFMELLDPSLGELESSVQFTFMLDIDWLFIQYHFAKVLRLPITIFYGLDHSEDLTEGSKMFPNITVKEVDVPFEIGCHHTKMMLFFYKDKSMRIVISTANLFYKDWHNRVQGVWISDKLPPLPEELSHAKSFDSETHFREDLIHYLMSYKLLRIQPIIARILRTDFSDVNVFFVGSVPGYHEISNYNRFGHLRLQNLLSQHCAPIDDDDCPIIMQASSIGNFGPTPSTYLLGEIAVSMSRDSASHSIRRLPDVKVIYPTINNVMNWHDTFKGGLPCYEAEVHQQQLWLQDYLYQWKSLSRDRNRAMPHIKSYCRYSDRGLCWFLLTSANISRSAWGSINYKSRSLKLNSYEAGVLFCPQIILKKDRFPLNETQRTDDNIPIFKLPYDVPPVKYEDDDIVCCSTYMRSYRLKTGLLEKSMSSEEESETESGSETGTK